VGCAQALAERHGDVVDSIDIYDSEFDGVNAGKRTLSPVVTKLNLQSKMSQCEIVVIFSGPPLIMMVSVYSTGQNQWSNLPEVGGKGENHVC